VAFFESELKSRASRGTTIFADISVVAAVGVDVVLAEVLDVMGLSREDVTWVQQLSQEETVARACEAEDYLRQRRRS
jgi:hypothetical protein